jgi:hypothetical protein
MVPTDVGNGLVSWCRRFYVVDGTDPQCHCKGVQATPFWLCCYVGTRAYRLVVLWVQFGNSHIAFRGLDADTSVIPCRAAY